MTVLVDSSVFIRFFAGREPFLSELGQMLRKRLVLGHEMVFGELLVGDVGGGRAQALALYKMMVEARVATHADVVTLVHARQLSGRGLAWIDVHLIASALLERVRLWTADKALDEAAAEFGIAFSPSR